ncbi:MAG: PAS domain S-box protein, partial [Candidatus Eremiobacterota bacterium]
MEQTLKELLELNQKIINSSYMGIAVYNSGSGRCVLANNSLAAMVGGTQDELLKQNFRNIASWKKSGMDKMAEEALATGKEMSDIFYIETTFNKKIYLECTFSSFTSNGEEHLLFIAGDITGKKVIENKLIESEEKYRQLIELAQEGVWVIDSEGNTIFVNPCMAEMLGYTEEEMVGKHIFCFIDERHISIAKNRRERRRQGIKEQHEFELLGKYGKRIYAIMSASPVTDERGNYNGAIALVKDITERKAMENSLNINNQIARVFLTTDSDEMYGEVLEVILKVLNSEYGLFGFINERGDFVCPSMTRDIWDKCRTADKNILFPREKWGGLWGRSLIERKTLYSNDPLHVPPGHIPLNNALVVPVLYQEKLIGILAVANKKEGYMNYDAALLESIAEFIAPVLKARLERDRFEKSLIESEEKLNSLIESMDDMIFQLDKNGIFLSYYTGVSGKDNLYVPEDMFIGKSFKKVLPLEVAIKLDEAMKGILSDHKTRSFDYSMKVSGKSRWYNATVSIYKDINGEDGGFTCVVRDITARHQTEEALMESERKYKTLYDSSRDAIMIVNPEEGFINGNPATIELFSCINEQEFTEQS